MIIGAPHRNGRASHAGDFGPRSATGHLSPQSVYKADYAAPQLYEELGRSGLRHWGGFVFEEWLQQLQYGRRAAEVFREMSDQDPILGAILYAIQMLIRRVDWWCEPKGSRAAEWFENEMHNMMFSWPDTISEVISFLPYGYSYHEIVYKQNEDGTIGVLKIPLRSQDSLWKWVFDDVGDLRGMIQNPPPDYLLRFIPIEKAMHFRTSIFKNDPEGRSILRNAYRSWWFVKNIQQIEAIGIERDLAGLPVLTPPEGVDIWDTEDPDMVSQLQSAKNTVSSVRRDEQEGVVLPFGWTLELMSSGGARQFDTSAIIGRYENRMATSVLADLVMMGQDKVGSYALAVTKKDLFANSLGAYLDIISSVFNTQLISKLWELNNFKDEPPKLCHGAVETIDLDTLGNFLQRIGKTGAPIDWESTLPYLNELAGLPQAPEGYDYAPRLMSAGGPGDTGPNDDGPPEKKV